MITRFGLLVVLAMAAAGCAATPPPAGLAEAAKARG